MEQAQFTGLVSEAWSAYDRAGKLPSRVAPAAPILFFGDLDAYRASPLRVLTVGLNPSLLEFPVDDPFSRFPLAEGPEGRQPERYLAALSAYYRTDPYRRWFNAFEPLLNGAGASYYPGETSTALHTDICSPVATNPTWNDLSDSDRVHLESEGRPLWHRLLEALAPHIVVLSIRKGYLRQIEFTPPYGDWSLIHEFKETKEGKPRRWPQRVIARWYEVGRESSLLVHAPAAQAPLGRLSSAARREIGELALESYKNGR